MPMYPGVIKLNSLQLKFPSICQQGILNRREDYRYKANAQICPQTMIRWPQGITNIESLTFIKQQIGVDP